MTEEERKNSTLAETEDVDREEQIVRYSLSDKEKTEAIQRIDNRIAELLKEDSNLTISKRDDSESSIERYFPNNIGVNRDQSSNANVNKKFGYPKEALNNLAHFISSNNIENKLQAENFPKTIGDILNLQNQKGDSRYYKSTISGTKTTLRISDHKGNAMELIKRGGRADKGISIVVRYDGLLPKKMEAKFKFDIMLNLR